MYTKALGPSCLQTCKSPAAIAHIHPFKHTMHRRVSVVSRICACRVSLWQSRWCTDILLINEDESNLKELHSNAAPATISCRITRCRLLFFPSVIVDELKTPWLMLRQGQGWTAWSPVGEPDTEAWSQAPLALHGYVSKYIEVGMWQQVRPRRRRSLAEISEERSGISTSEAFNKDKGEDRRRKRWRVMGWQVPPLLPGKTEDWIVD